MGIYGNNYGNNWAIVFVTGDLERGAGIDIILNKKKGNITGKGELHVVTAL